MFSRPSSALPGLHVISLDTRSGRSATFREGSGSCLGAASRMLRAEQWAWLDDQLARPSAVKIIASGIQVLPPTDLRSRDAHSYCAYDGAGGTFDSSVAAVGEGERSVGTGYESWAEMPQERARLLQKCQRAINDGITQVGVTVALW